MKNLLFILLGYLFVALGIIGIFLPLVPTTIFLIIASYFFMKGSPKLNQKLLNNKYLGHYVKNYYKYKGMTLKSKVSAIVMLWIAILFSVIYVVEFVFIKIFLILLAIGISTYILLLKTLSPDLK